MNVIGVVRFTIEERIGNVSTGLTDEAVAKRMMQHKLHFLQPSHFHGRRFSICQV